MGTDKDVFPNLRSYKIHRVSLSTILKIESLPTDVFRGRMGAQPVI